MKDALSGLAMSLLNEREEASLNKQPKGKAAKKPTHKSKMAKPVDAAMDSDEDRIEDGQDALLIEKTPKSKLPHPTPKMADGGKVPTWLAAKGGKAPKYAKGTGDVESAGTGGSKYFKDMPKGKPRGPMKASKASYVPTEADRAIPDAVSPPAFNPDEALMKEVQKVAPPKAAALAEVPSSAVAPSLEEGGAGAIAAAAKRGISHEAPELVGAGIKAASDQAAMTALKRVGLGSLATGAGLGLLKGLLSHSAGVLAEPILNSTPAGDHDMEANELGGERHSFTPEMENAEDYQGRATAQMLNAQKYLDGKDLSKPAYQQVPHQNMQPAKPSFQAKPGVLPQPKAKEDDELESQFQEQLMKNFPEEWQRAQKVR